MIEVPIMIEVPTVVVVFCGLLISWYILRLVYKAIRYFIEEVFIVYEKGGVRWKENNK